MVQFDDSYTRKRHHAHTAFEYFEWKRVGVVKRVWHYVFPSAIAVVWLLVFAVVCVAIALVTLNVELPGGW